jgi:acetyl-CoA carboxylase biotin carboxyl carrier protein
MSEPEAPPDRIDARLVQRLATILNSTGLTEIEVQRGDLRIRVARSAAPASYAVAAPPVPVAVPTVAVAAPAAAPAAAPPAPVEAPPEGEIIKSPMVGTVYLQPQPGAQPFVRPGESIAEGQTLLIIEAMKTMNPIPAPRAGRIVRLLVIDGQPVEFGEPLAVIE